MAEIIKHDDVEGQLKVQGLAGLAKGHFSPSRGVISRKVVAAAEQADEIIHEARETTNQLLKQARELKKRMASRVKTERKKGYEKGYQEGLAQVTEQLVAALEPTRRPCSEKIAVARARRNEGVCFPKREGQSETRMRDPVLPPRRRELRRPYWQSQLVPS